MMVTEVTEGTEATVSQEQRRNEDERRAAVRCVGVPCTPTAAMYESANTSRRRRQSGLYLRSRTSWQAACGGPSNSLPAFTDLRGPSWSSWLKKIPFVSVPPLLL